MKRNRKNIILLGLLLFTVFFTVIGGSYAFFSVIFQDTRNNGVTSFTTGNLSNATIVSDIPNGVGSFLSTDIYPGHKEVLGLSVTGSGSKDSKSYFQFKYKVGENGLGSNVKISVYRSGTPIETQENHFNCVKQNEKIEGSNDTKYFETCEEKDLGLLLKETVLTGGEEDIVIGKDTITIKNENEDVTKYYYVVVEFLNKEESQNELMNRSLVGKVEVELTTPFEKDYTNNIEGIATSLNENYEKEETFSIHVTSEKYRLVSMSEDNKTFEDLPEKSKDITIEKTVTENGTYNYYFQDEAENVQEVVMEATKVDTEPPTLNVTAEEYLDGLKVDASKSSDTLSGIKTYYYKLNEGEYIESNKNTHTFTGLSDGDYKVRIKIEDNAENISEEKEMDVTIAYEKVYISSSGNDETGNGAIDNPYASLQLAYNKVKSGGSMILQSNITATSTTTMNIENKNVILKSNGTNKYTIIKSSNLTTQILYLTNSNNLTTENVIFDGNNANTTGSLIESYNSKVTLNSTILRNNINIGRYYSEFAATGAIGGAIFAYKSTLRINTGSIIKSNRVKNTSIANGGGVAVFNSIMELNDGTITENATLDAPTGGKNGGGIVVFGESTFTFKNGIISYNEAQYGGGVCVDHSSISMSGGIISNNTASSSNGLGGGINIANAQLDMSGGTIKNNTASFLGGGVYVWESTFNLKYGTISSNTADDSGGGVWVCGKTNNSTMTMTNGQITSNIAKKYGGGVCIKRDASNIQVVANLKGGNVSGNTAPTGPDTYAMNGAQILNN